MTVKERLKEFIKHENMGQGRFEKSCGLSNGYVNNIRRSIQPDKLQKIARCYPHLNTGWLMTGEGEMLKPVFANAPVPNFEHQGVPYYDVDFIGGFDLVENNQSINPDYHIDFAPYNKADSWVNITGHSMEPLISLGDMIALKKIEDWETYILYGEVYAVVTDAYRTVKKLRRSNREGFIRLVPINPDYDEQEIRCEVIRSVFQVVGCAKRIF